jgi:KaiC/GvpD/RAD55 family RecA-like ATPase
MVITDFGIQEMHDIYSSNEFKYLLQFYNKDDLSEYLENDYNLLKSLYQKTQPKKVPIGSLYGKTEKNNFLVTSPDGLVQVMDCIQKIKSDMYEVVFGNGVSIKASHDHLFQKPDQSWHYTRDLSKGDIILSEDSYEEIKEITFYQKKTNVYDLSVGHKNHRYYTAGICSHNSGKSLVMMNLALNFLSQGLSGVYITLELSEELTSLRTDAMLTKMSTKDIRKDLDAVELKVRMAAKKSGKYRVKGLPAQSNVNSIRSYIKEVQIQTGMPVDFVMIDYLDLVMPVSVKVNPNDQFIKDKYVSEELRNLAKELGVLMVTASQLNRSAVEEIEFDHSHIAGGISKINTADYVFGIFTSRSMKERGKYQIQCMKSRSSTGVGQKIDLEYDIDTMRITDEGGDENTPARTSASDIMSRIQRNTSTTNTETVDTDTGEITETRKVVADVNGTKLKSLLSSLKKG